LPNSSLIQIVAETAIITHYNFASVASRQILNICTFNIFILIELIYTIRIILLLELYY